jgi:membrane protease subunit (stomatin/prohibitin family)
MMRRGVGRVGRPGLIGTAARTAVVVGAASATAGAVQHHQEEKAQQRAYEQDQQQAPQQQAAQEQAPAAPAPSADDKIALLKQLADLKDQGILTEEEFAAQKAKILA